MVMSQNVIKKMPKVLLHDHLDGGLRTTTILDIADSIGWKLPENRESSLQAWFTRGAETRDIMQYLATFEHTFGVLQNGQALERVAEEAVEDLADDGVVYAEIRFAPELHQQKGMTLEEAVEAVCSGLKKGEERAFSKGQKIRVNLICCAIRMAQRSMEIVQLVDVMRQSFDRVVGFDIAGAESEWPPSLHAEAFQYARERLINITIHASEPPDCELISGALDQGAHRIGHGVRITSDIQFENGSPVRYGRLSQYILDHQIHLEMAPTCHVQIGAVDEIENHPMIPLLRAGFNVGVNTDNRLMSNVSCSSELHILAKNFNLSFDEAHQLHINAMNASFAPYQMKKEIIEGIINPGFSRLTHQD
jgi:adenosine deaminase